MKEKLYDLVVFSDGDARVYDHMGEDKYNVFSEFHNSTFTTQRVQVSPDKELLIKIAGIARADFVRRMTGQHAQDADYWLVSVDQTGDRYEREAI